MPMRMNPRKGHADRLFSWKGPEDPSTGDFSIGGDASTGLQAMIWHGSSVVWRSTAWSGNTVLSSFTWSNSNTAIIVKIAIDGDDMSLTFDVAEGSSAMNARMSYMGKNEYNIWSSTASKWVVFYTYPDSGCDRYAACGPFGYCDGTDPAGSMCKCPDGFEPHNGTSPSGSGGCARKVPLGCGSEDQFVTMQAMKS
ncbi:hypothetical protein BS78_06G243300 [Paspalum vaginatum]|nr:hypothetical protein BS78_06G243300 [Paspalum vaginatum]